MKPRQIDIHTKEREEKTDDKNANAKTTENVYMDGKLRKLGKLFGALCAASLNLSMKFSKE